MQIHITYLLSEITDCSERDGLADCSNICLPSVVGYVCACADGQQLNENGKTCDNGKVNILESESYFDIAQFVRLSDGL